MDRRRFLIGGAGLGCSLAASPWLTPIALAEGPWDNRLVVIILRGAMDGLDVFRPFGDPDYQGLRPDLDDGAGQTIDDFWGLHPALSPLWPLWQAGQVGAVHAVSTPYRDKRSHFDGQDLLESGGVALDGRIKDGWLNRLLQTVPGARADIAYAIGADLMPILAGSAPAARWSPDARLRLSPQAQRLLEVVYHDDPLFQAASAQAIEIVAQVASDAGADEAMAADMNADPMMAAVTGTGDAGKIAKFAAARLRGATRIASFSINGWDTHLNQQAGLTRALSQLSDTILTLRTGLGPVWDKTAILCLTEFGRTARQNGTRGTDHGTAGAMLFAGGALRGGRVMGTWPGLAEADLYDRRDLMPTADVRAMAGWVMHGVMGLDRSAIAGTVFPGLDLGSDPGLGA